MSTATSPVKTPSAADMVALLSSDEAPAPPRDVIALPRPRWWIRAITLACVLILACLGLATAVAALALDELATRIVETRQQKIFQAHAVLPPAEILRDDAAFRDAVRRYDGEAHRVVAARLAQQSDPRDIDHTCRLAERTVTTKVHLLLTWAEALCDLDRRAEARVCMEALAGRSLDDAQMARAARVAERIHLLATNR